MLAACVDIFMNEWDVWTREVGIARLEVNEQEELLFKHGNNNYTNWMEFALFFNINLEKHGILITI